MAQTLVVQERFVQALGKECNAKILRSRGYQSPAAFLQAIIDKLNNEFAFLNISGFRYCQNKAEREGYGQYGGFVYGTDLPYEKVTVYFTPIESKQGNVIIEQSLMPTICKQMEKDIAFLSDERYKNIVLLTSKINEENKVPVTYNKMQMDVNSLNTLHFDVIPFFPIKNLSTDTRFCSLTEYLDMSEYLQKKAKNNAQTQYLRVEDGVLYGDCLTSQMQGEFQKSFCFRFLTAMFAGGSSYKYSIAGITERMQKLDNQFENLKKFIAYANATPIMNFALGSFEDDTVESDEEVQDISDMHRPPEKATSSSGRKRFKTQKRIKDAVLEAADFYCDCDDKRHFYFESSDYTRYVEGHHIVPMNRQEELWRDEGINIDITSNLVPLCPNCHTQIHRGSRQARIEVLSEIFTRNKARLHLFKSDLTLVLLASYYNIGLSDEDEEYWLKKSQKRVEDKANKKL